MPLKTFLTRRNLLIAAGSLIALSVATFLLLRTKAKDQQAFGRYIESYTAGVIPRASMIHIRLANTVQVTHGQNEEVKGLFSFSPAIDGKAYWIDAQTIEFRPDEDLDPGENYEATFDLGAVTKVPGDLDEFSFEFSTIKPDFAVVFDGLEISTPTSTTTMKLIGKVMTADTEEDSKIEKVIKAQYGNDTKVSWKHEASMNTHTFTIDGLTRLKDKSQAITVSWNGDPLDLEKSGEQTFDVPAIGDFKVLDIKAVQESAQYMLCQFSEPIRVGQDLNGLIGLEGLGDFSFTIEGSTVKAYPVEKLEGNYTAFVHEGVEDIYRQKIRKAFTANVFFENRLPSVSIPGKGVILPDSGKLKLPFEATNLNAVDVTVIRIYENNVPQYFQDNNFDGTDNLRKVGKPMVQTTVRLDRDRKLNLGRKNRFMLDLDKLMRAEPGAIYQVIIGFRKDYSLYSCGSAASVIASSPAEEGEDEDYEGEYYYEQRSIDEDDEFWQRYDNYYPNDYRWNERDDACTNSYFTKDRWATRNVIASNIGLLAKRGTDNSMLIAATDILSAKPIAGVDFEFLDYQKQVIQTARSDGEGFAQLNLKRKPYLLVAKRGKERGYLKLDDGNSLPLSRFDVAGEQVQKGLKGFIYGDRGVWRPGDSLFLTFVLEDKQQTLPADHPVDFTLYDPKGQLVKQLTRTSSVDHFYSFHVKTEPDAPTGNWLAKVKVGGARFERQVKVETVMPNRLKVELSFGEKDKLDAGDNTGTLSARWLFGGTAQNLKARVEAFLTAQPTAFKGFEDYVFDDPTESFSPTSQTVFEGKLDADGNATVDARIDLEKHAPGRLKANFIAKVFEAGGAFSIRQQVVPYDPYDTYIGMKAPKGRSFNDMLTTDANNVIDLVALDTDGKLKKTDITAEVELYKVQWRWWWDGNNDVLRNFTQNEYNKLVKSETVEMRNGKGKWVLRVPREDWGRYLVRVTDKSGGHTTGKVLYIDWPDWSRRMQSENPTEAAMLSFTSDKKSYKVGEKATLTIPTPANGRALISFENGTKVVKSSWIETQRGQTRYTFEVEASMAPNVFANVTLLQPHNQTVNDLPIRMYGAIPLSVDDPATVLKPVISMPDKIRPQSPASVTVSEASGQEMTYTIAIVDEGLLDLTNFKTPDPHQAFYAREGLGVKTWDLFDYVIGAFGNGLERILSIGGDGTGGVNKNVTVNRFKPVVKFLGPYTLKAGEKQTRAFTLPQYIGSVRVMVVAGHVGKYGFAEKAVAVKKPLMILATVPRVLGPGEHIQLPVSVFATEASVKKVTLRLTSDQLISTAGELQKSVSFSRPGDQLVTFDLDVKKMIGPAKIRIEARSGGETAGETVDVEIRTANPEITAVKQKDLAPGESWTVGYNAIGMAGTTGTTLEVSSIPSLNLAKRLSYLIHYPYGCVEQTTSSGFPQLYLGQLTQLSPAQKAEVERNIQSTIARLNGFRTSSGGLSYWPGEAEPDEWATNYAGHFLLSAQSRGYLLPSGLLDGWKRYQKQQAIHWSPAPDKYFGYDQTQAYRLYLLALARVPEIGAMNRLKEYQYLSIQAKWQLAAAYKLAGQPEVALQLISGLPTNIKPYKALYGTYGSDLRDEAIILEVLTLLGQRQRASAVMRSVAADLSRPDWYSTQTTAYSLLAIAAYCGENSSPQKLQFEYTAGKQRAKIASESYIWQLPLGADGSLQLRNNGSARLYLRLVQKGKPAPGQEPKITGTNNQLRMNLAYYTVGGTQIDPASLKQGTDFVARVTVRNTGNTGTYRNMALSQLFPSGWEILNSRLMGNEDAFKSSVSDYRDFRDDRVYTYFAVEEGKEAVFYVMLTAAYAGRYYLPATYAEAMYDASISAVTGGRWVDVTH